jgi:hypothetical protein
MRLHLATSLAVASLVAVPAALATAPGASPINGSYKGRTGQNLVTTFDIAQKRVKTFTTSVQRFCSDGTSSYSRIVATGLSGQPDAALRRGLKATWKIDLTVTTSTGPTARVRGTLRKGWITGTVAFSDVAALPMGPSDGGPNTPPGTGATCSTNQATTSNRITFTSPWG